MFYTPVNADRETIEHEYGHMLQYKSEGGTWYWNEVMKGFGSDKSYLEQNADYRATQHYGHPVCDYASEFHYMLECNTSMYRY